MFTGLIDTHATLHSLQGKAIKQSPQCISIELKFDENCIWWDDIKIGESIAVNGCCLSVTQKNEDSRSLSFDINHETLSLTTVSSWKLGERVHVEPALRGMDRLGGHLLSGHVDTKGRKKSWTASDQGGWDLVVSVSKEFEALVVSKGSISIHGVSLTINEVCDADDTIDIRLTIIPITVEKTNLDNLEIGGEFNVEFDMFAKMIDRQLKLRQARS